jgi:hypothetical protein
MHDALVAAKQAEAITVAHARSSHAFILTSN